MGLTMTNSIFHSFVSNSSNFSFSAFQSVPLLALALFATAHGAHLPAEGAPVQARQIRQNPNVAREAVDQPVGIVRSSFLPQLDGTFEYSFESENGIKQQAFGQRKAIGEDGSDVIVMKGSYEYIGPDGNIYVVDWEADENGYRATAPHLPQPVEIPFPEQRAAVEAQLRFAAEEEERARQGKALRPEGSSQTQNQRKKPVQVAPAQVDYSDDY